MELLDWLGFWKEAMKITCIGTINNGRDNSEQRYNPEQKINFKLVARKNVGQLILLRRREMTEQYTSVFIGYSHDFVQQNHYSDLFRLHGAVETAHRLPNLTQNTKNIRSFIVFPIPWIGKTWFKRPNPLQAQEIVFL